MRGLRVSPWRCSHRPPLPLPRRPHQSPHTKRLSRAHHRAAGGVTNDHRTRHRSIPGPELAIPRPPRPVVRYLGYAQGASVPPARDLTFRLSIAVPPGTRPAPARGVFAGGNDHALGAGPPGVGGVCLRDHCRDVAYNAVTLANGLTRCTPWPLGYACHTPSPNESKEPGGGVLNLRSLCSRTDRLAPAALKVLVPRLGNHQPGGITGRLYRREAEQCIHWCAPYS